MEFMKPSILEKLERLAERLEEIDGLLGGESAARDMDGYRKLTRERSDILPAVELFQAYRAASADFAGAGEMLDDPEMKELARAEQESAATETMARLAQELQRELLPKDPNDDRNLFLEIRAGTGGDESALFAADLFRMYSRYAERQRWKVEIVSRSESDLGGFREIIARIEGIGAYSRLKFESGGHRVQRVPVTETQGRIHTSACTVAVMPEADELGDMSTSIRPTCASTPFALRAPAASTSTRPIRRCASPTCPPASSSNARTIVPSTATRRRPCRFWRRASTMRSSANSNSASPARARA
jgi:peptide chain release factor 1